MRDDLDRLVSIPETPYGASGGEAWRESPQGARGEPRTGVIPTDESLCHCARLLPAVRRWVSASQAVRVVELPPGWLEEFCEARDALEALVMELP